MTDQEHEWNHRLIMRALRNAIRVRQKADFMDYCRDLAERRLQQGFDGSELIGALQTLNEVCLEILHADPEADDMVPHLPTCITMTLRFGIDQVKDKMDEMQQEIAEYVPPPGRSDTGDGCPL
jgi:hypothetical protein